MSTVSVIIPTWNRAATVVVAIRSALAQSRPPLEVLVCDDGSTDGTEARVRAIGDSRVRWLAGPRAGHPSMPRNRGIAAALGEWLAFLDSDDEWLPEKLERQLAAVSASGRRAACTDAWRRRPGDAPMVPLLDEGMASLHWADLARENRVICSSALIHRSLFDAVEGFPEAVSLKALEDYALWLRVATFTEFDYVAKPLLVYHDDPANSLRANDMDVWTQRRRVFGDFVNWYGRNAHRVPRALYKVAQRECRIAFIRWFARRAATACRLRP